MKKSLITIIVSILALTVLPGCKKGNELFMDRGAFELKDCPITQIVRNQFSIPDTMAFTYNSWGDPVSIERLPYAGTGAPHYVFKYDNKRRLTDIIGLYTGGSSAEVWHKYFYENPGKGNITRDSSFGFVTIKNGVITGFLYCAVTYLNYDKYDRIINDSVIITNHPEYTLVHTYAYDENGNRVGRTYDNKINMHRTNKIWMFYDRDYSVNNPFFADSYNATGLPTQFTSSTKNVLFIKFMGEDFFNARIAYGCKK